MVTSRPYTEDVTGTPKGYQSLPCDQLLLGVVLGYETDGCLDGTTTRPGRVRRPDRGIIYLVRVGSTTRRLTL